MAGCSYKILLSSDVISAHTGWGAGGGGVVSRMIRINASYDGGCTVQFLLKVVQAEVTLSTPRYEASWVSIIHLCMWLKKGCVLLLCREGFLFLPCNN
jgi:hypothetical protein